ncbi:MAG: hypothetical protein PHH59_10810 [Methylovulum sp.]|uniref:hypothetical protein n=1 Tax=Methylovulum sp. TaxID=1916980 RepID=UPI00262CF11F|nr:hypothetical protein [Methylovulum sp.]MDD2724497.1 hypothetical protein [Methylovulum sp.]MDD5124113.1 hypothetical protein [Methylovulum sp.]
MRLNHNIGNDLANMLIGNAATNILNGGAGADTFKSGLGDDFYIVDLAGDTVVENASEGIDTVQAAVTYILAANVENLTLTGLAAINGIGNTLANTLNGNAAADTLNGGNGADTAQSSVTFTLAANMWTTAWTAQCICLNRQVRTRWSAVRD